eukprot:TRINITY_DN7884_c0_g1_i1.p1 TRINITY_DN7884_c0_g1~~TRINITY_DN7884_c0_g1_i1.p1  ORF type:complete len:670 (-),score=96.06 TRINITY_DN7884_c0_g1_i1:123-2132(-)
MKIVYALFVSLLVGLARSDSATTLKGSGASSQSLLWNMIGFVYKGVNPDVEIDYLSTNSGGGVADITHRVVDFAGSDTYQTNINGTNQLPIAGLAIAIMFNVPGLDNLVLDGPTLRLIFAGGVSHWNDPTISALNPGFVFPNSSITVIYRTGGSGTNSVFCSALKVFGANATLSNDPVTWPFAREGRGIPAAESTDIISLVRNIPNSIGYVAHPFSQGQPVVTMVNKKGNFIAPTEESVIAAINSPAFEGKIQSLYLNGDGEDAYPITTLTFLLYHTDTLSDCSFTLSLVEMIYWLSSSSLASQAATYQNYMPVPASISGPAIKDLTLIKCNGKYAYNYLATFEWLMLYVGIGMACACLVLTLLVIATQSAYLSRPNELILDLIGKIASYLSTYLWVGFPHDWVCKCRPFIVFLCFSAVAGELGYIGSRVLSARRMSKVNVKQIKHSEFKIMAGLFSGSMFIVVLWMLVSVPKEVHRRCETDDTQLMFTFLLVGYNLILMAVGPLLKYYMKKRHRVTDISLPNNSQRSLMITLVSGAVWLPVNLIGGRNNYSVLGRLLSPASGTLVYTSLLLLFVVLPQLKPTWKSILLKLNIIGSGSAIWKVPFSTESYESELNNSDSSVLNINSTNNNNNSNNSSNNKNSNNSAQTSKSSSNISLKSLQVTTIEELQ